MLYGPNGGVLVTPPRQRGRQCWTDLLNDPWDKNPQVVMMVMPDRATFEERGDGENIVFSVMVVDNKRYGVQVLRPEGHPYPQCDYVFRKAGIPMWEPAFIGRLHDVPQKHLVINETHPVVFLYEDMSGDYLNLRRCWTARTEEQRKETWQ